MNETIFFFFYNFTHRSDFLDGLVVFFAVYFIYVVIALAFVFLFWCHRISPPPKVGGNLGMGPKIEEGVLESITKWKEFISLSASGILAWVLAKILKILFATSRPFDLFPLVEPLFLEVDHAFPSGHTLVASAIAFSLFFTHKKTGYIFILFALLIGVARIMAGVHSPVDILGGFALGALIAYLVAYFAKNV